jgi:hypothetical protein
MNVEVGELHGKSKVKSQKSKSTANSQQPTANSQQPTANSQIVKVGFSTMNQVFQFSTMAAFSRLSLLFCFSHLIFGLVIHISRRGAAECCT